MHTIETIEKIFAESTNEANRVILRAQDGQLDGKYTLTNTLIKSSSNPDNKNENGYIVILTKKYGGILINGEQ